MTRLYIIISIIVCTLLFFSLSYVFTSALDNNFLYRMKLSIRPEKTVEPWDSLVPVVQKDWKYVTCNGTTENCGRLG